MTHPTIFGRTNLLRKINKSIHRQPDSFQPLLVARPKSNKGPASLFAGGTAEATIKVAPARHGEAHRAVQRAGLTWVAQGWAEVGGVNAGDWPQENDLR